MRAQEERKRERHARDGVWRPAGGERPVARSFPGSRRKPSPGIVKGRGIAPLPAPVKRQVGKSPLPTEGGADYASLRPV